MSDYIKRDDAIAACEDGVLIPRDCKAFFYEVLSELPAVDMRENKCGHWEMPVNDGFTLFQCSNCGYNRIARTEPNFCEHCGADMRGVRDK